MFPTFTRRFQRPGRGSQPRLVLLGLARPRSLPQWPSFLSPAFKSHEALRMLQLLPRSGLGSFWPRGNQLQRLGMPMWSNTSEYSNLAAAAEAWAVQDGLFRRISHRCAFMPSAPLPLCWSLRESWHSCGSSRSIHKPGPLLRRFNCRRPLCS